jgi:regulator of replication initiation timing
MNKFFLIILFLLVFPSIVFLQSDDLYRVTKKQLEEKQQRVNRLVKENYRLKNENATSRDRIDYLASQLDINEKKLASALQDFYTTSLLLKAREEEVSRFSAALTDYVATNQSLRYQNSLLTSTVSDLTSKITFLSTDIVQQNQRNENYQDDMEDDLDDKGKTSLYENAKSKAENKVSGGSSSRPDKAERRKRNYLSLGIGAGTNYSGVGLCLQSRIGGLSGIGFHVSGGLIPDEQILVGAGFKFFYYKGGFIDFSYNSNVKTLNPSSSSSDFKFTHYMSVSTGWDIYLTRRFGLKIAVGGYYIEETREVLPGGDFGFSYKF